MLSDSERFYLLGKLKPSDGYRWKLDSKIKKKVKSALEDLTLIAENHNEKQIEKIFTSKTILPFIHALLLRNMEPPAKFKIKGPTRVAEPTNNQWYLAWRIEPIARARIQRGRWRV